MHFFPAPESGWTPQVLTYSGFYNIGVKEIWDMIYEYIDFVKTNGYFEYRRNEQSKYWMYETINEQLRDSFYHNPTIEAMLADKESQVLKGKSDILCCCQEPVRYLFCGIAKISGMHFKASSPLLFVFRHGLHRFTLFFSV